MTSSSILLIEDNADEAEMTIRALERKYTVDITHLQDGEQAIVYLKDPKNVNPQLILLDLRMPRIDGIEVLRWIKSDATRKTVPVIMLTSSSHDNDVVDSYNLGVNSYIVKPVDSIKFHDAIHQIGSFWLKLSERSLS